jgi:pimeloyl-ACP methyl ester carboxylesterase
VFRYFHVRKLRVPLDYENEAAGTTHVSFIKWTVESNSTSTNATTQDILFNPGGPGSSGISFVEQALPVLQQIVGTAYNIIGFDPRGVNNSGPNLSCFPGGEHGTSRLYGNPAILDVNDTKSYSEVYAKAAAFGEFCTKAHSGPNGTAQYANTVATANDMRHYTELLAKSKGEDPQKSQLWYYGVSYGSALGTTFASLFPDRVGRVIVDGILDVENYYQGKWELPDADKAFRSFFQTCYDAGQNGTCVFWATSPAAIEARYNAVVANLARSSSPKPHTTLSFFSKLLHKCLQSLNAATRALLLRSCHWDEGQANARRGRMRTTTSHGYSLRAQTLMGASICRHTTNGSTMQMVLSNSHNS